MIKLTLYLHGHRIDFKFEVLSLIIIIVLILIDKTIIAKIAILSLKLTHL